MQAAIRTAADRIGNQYDGLREETGGRKQEKIQRGTVLVSEAGSSQDVVDEISTTWYPGGEIKYETDVDLERSVAALEHRGPEVASYLEVVVRVK